MPHSCNFKATLELNDKILLNYLWPLTTCLSSLKPYFSKIVGHVKTGHRGVATSNVEGSKKGTMMVKDEMMTRYARWYPSIISYRWLDDLFMILLEVERA